MDVLLGWIFEALLRRVVQIRRLPAVLTGLLGAFAGAVSLSIIEAKIGLKDYAVVLLIFSASVASFWGLGTGITGAVIVERMNLNPRWFLSSLFIFSAVGCAVINVPIHFLLLLGG